MCRNMKGTNGDEPDFGIEQGRGGATRAGGPALSVLLAAEGTMMAMGANMKGDTALAASSLAFKSPTLRTATNSCAGGMLQMRQYAASPNPPRGKHPWELLGI